VIPGGSARYGLGEAGAPGAVVGCWLGALAVDEPLSQAVRQDASGVHEPALRAIAAVTKQTPDTPAAAALA
jgi:hypothetical protein